MWELELTVAPLRRRVKWIFWLWLFMEAARVTALFCSCLWLGPWFGFCSLGRRCGGDGCDPLASFFRTCCALDRSTAEPLARAFFRQMWLDEDADEDEDTPLRTRREEVAVDDDDATRMLDDERLSVAPRAPLSSFRSRFNSEGIGPSGCRRRREASSALRSTGPLRASLCPPDATTPLHLSQSTWRGRSLIAFMMEVGSS